MSCNDQPGCFKRNPYPLEHPRGRRDQRRAHAVVGVKVGQTRVGMTRGVCIVFGEIARDVQVMGFIGGCERISRQVRQ